MTGRRQERGIALVVVLWVSLLIAAIAGAFILDTRTSARLARNFVDNAEARALADGGVHLAVFELLRPDEDRRWRRDGRIYRQAVTGGLLEIAIEDEAGKIDLNLAGDALLEGLFLSAGMEPPDARALVAAIGAVRSGDDTHERLLRGAGVPADQLAPLVDAIEASRRRSSPRRPSGRGSREAGGVSDRSFFAVDALGQFPGITTDLYARLQPALTVYGSSDGLDYLAAPRVALRAVPGVPAEAIDLFLAGRSGADALAPLDEFLGQGRAREFWRRNESAFVTVKVLARAENGASFARIAIVEIDRNADEPFLVREWREGDAAMFPSAPPPPEPDSDRAGGVT